MINHEVKKKYEMIEIPNIMIRSIEIKSMIGKEINKNKIIFQWG